MDEIQEALTKFTEAVEIYGSDSDLAEEAKFSLMAQIYRFEEGETKGYGRGFNDGKNSQSFG